MYLLYIMANISNQLKDIFIRYLKRLEDEKHSSRSNHFPTYSQMNLFNNDNFNGIIYFYEWSDIDRTPKTFYTLKAFENFMDKCDIYLASYQKEIIRHLNTPCIACKKGSKEIIIKPTRQLLMDALGNNPNTIIPISTNKGSEDKEPYVIQCTHPPKSKDDGGVKIISCKIYPPSAPTSMIRKPPMYVEPENRWDGRDEMHPEVGGCWGW